MYVYVKVCTAAKYTIEFEFEFEMDIQIILIFLTKTKIEAAIQEICCSNLSKIQHLYLFLKIFTSFDLRPTGGSYRMSSR